MKEIENALLRTEAGNHWQQVGVRHHHGFCIPLFSLHSEHSCGIGEYLDLLPLLSWCKEIGFDVIQLLPLNDTGSDKSPYNALSANALNPLFLSISSLPLIEKVPQHEEKIAALRRWNLSSQVKYTIVRELKRIFLRDYFRENFEEISQAAAYQHFCQENPWVESYGLFKALKDTHAEKCWEDWPTECKYPSSDYYQYLLDTHRKEVDFHILTQFLCFLQLITVKRKAAEFGILLKGDIPILISRDSVDVWRNPSLFLLDKAAGAPPDVYTTEGQYWGFPVYNWQELERTGYAWWKERLRIAANFYNLYRIDHVVGFFRLWSIPLNHPAKEGSFIPPEEHAWIPHGRKLMEMMLQSAPSLFPIGEDLGLIPPSVRHCLAELGIPGTKMMRWERRWDGDGQFIPPSEYIPASMTTVSTHDSDTLQLWWRHFPKEAKLYAEYKKWPYEPFLSLDHHKDILFDSHHSGSLFHINLLQEYLALFPDLVSLNPNDERINIPGKILDQNWTYRFIPSVEQLTTHAGLKQAMKSLIQ